MRIGNVLGLVPPLGVAGSGVDFYDAAKGGDVPGAVAAAAGMIPSVRGVAKLSQRSAGEPGNETELFILRPAGARRKIGSRLRSPYLQRMCRKAE